jgi:selenocysteine-specific elongation factor
MRVVATAGHVDHGKSTLVLALTGTDPDRLAEEKTRGLTIDLGFAFTTLPSGLEVGFVDVPGHVRFVKNMLAGVGAVDVVVLVVAANEGWMPQSEEHLQIVELLGMRHGLAVITKADTVDAETLELARLDVDEHLVGSALAGAPVVSCDARSGRGLDELRDALETVLAAAPVAVDRGRARMWVDRVFTVKGAGTVVTGTLAGGSFAVDDDVEVGAPPRPARIRGIETAHRAVDRVAPGARVALNLAGVDGGVLRRGDAVVHAGQWLLVDVVDAAIQPLRGSRLARRTTLHAHVGSGEYPTRARMLDDDGRYARLRLATPVPLVPGDRIVLRDPGRARTVGGAEVLDISPPGPASDALPRLGLPVGPRVLTGRKWVSRSQLGSLTGRGDREADVLARELVNSGAAIESDGWLIDSSEVARVRSEAHRRVTAHHERRPHDHGLTVPALARALRIEPDQLRAAVARDDAVGVSQGVVRLASQNGRLADRPEAVQLLAALAAKPFSPPDPGSVGGQPDLVRALVREGALVDLDGVVFTADAVATAREQVGGAVRARGSLTVADVRDLLGSTRKYVVPILAHLDAQGVTRRRGDDRIAGPAA